MKYIDFNLRDHNTVYYAAAILIVMSHGIHLTSMSDMRMAFKALFIMAYVAFIASELIQDGKIHIVTLTYRLMIIGLVSYAIYLRQGVFSNYS